MNNRLIQDVQLFTVVHNKQVELHPEQNPLFNIAPFTQLKQLEFFISLQVKQF